MEWMEIRISSDKTTVETIVDLFCRLGSGGAIIEDPLELRALAASGQWDAFDLPEESLSGSFPAVKGYFPFNEAYEEKMAKLTQGTALVTSRMGVIPAKISARKVADEDWANSWKVHFKPLKIGQRLVVRPAWEEYSPGEGEIVLDLDPGMAFGTGGHATTAMAAALLEKHLQAGNSVIDVGTGTGILAMFASFLGAETVLALDNDAVAVKVAEKNIEQNGLGGKIRIQLNDLLAGISVKADLIAANIIADIIIKLIPQAGKCLQEKGLLLVSGIIKERREDVRKAALKEGFELWDEKTEGEWVAQVWQIRM